jgi:hypothetical protein
MNVIHLAFPCVSILARAIATGPAEIDTPDLHGIEPYAVEAGLQDRSWRRVSGPETLAPSTSWFRGDLGALACAIETEDSVTLHVIARDGTPLARRVMTARNSNRIG